MFSNFLHFSNFYIKLSNFAVVLFSYFVFSIKDNTDTYLPRNLPLSWNGFRKILVSSISFLANTTWKVDDINRTIFLRSIAYISFCGQPWTSLFCIHKHDGPDRPRFTQPWSSFYLETRLEEKYDKHRSVMESARGLQPITNGEI